MSLAVFEAATQSAALAQMRSRLGDDALIVDCRQTAIGVRLTGRAAVDLEALLTPPAATSCPPVVDWLTGYHKPRTGLARQWRRQATAGIAAFDDETATASLFARSLAFAPLDDIHRSAAPAERPLIVVGCPGAGKSAIVARLALARRQAGASAEVLTTESDRAGGFSRLSELVAPMGIRAKRLSAESADKTADRARLIDTLGVNPHIVAEMENLAQTITGLDARPVLAFAAGGDADDGFETARAFAAIGVRHAIVSQLDLSRRLGAVWALAEAGIALCGATISPLIAKPVLPLTADGLARLALRHRPAATS